MEHNEHEQPGDDASDPPDTSDTPTVVPAGSPAVTGAFDAAPGDSPGQSSPADPVGDPSGNAPPPPWLAPAASSPPPPPPPPPSGTGRRTLQRDVRSRMLGGVAAGLAEYFEIDPLLVRIAFVVLALVGGSGVLLYLAGWFLIPAEGTERAVAHDWLQPRTRPRSVIVIVIGAVLAVLALSNLFSSGPWWPRWDGGSGGFGFYFGVFALVLAGALLVASGRRQGSPLRWLFLTGVVTVLAVIAVVAATVFSVEALSGVPLHGGIGDTQWRPTSAAQVSSRYRLAVGTMVVDLRDVSFRPGTTNVTATVGIGHLLVEVPPGPSVSVTAHSGMGDVQVFGLDDGGFSTGQTMHVAGTVPAGTGSAPHLVLEAETGVGQVQVVRS